MILAVAFDPWGSVGQTCERHRIGSGKLYTWRRLAVNGQLGGMNPSGHALAASAFAEVTLGTGPIVRSTVYPAQLGLIRIDLRQEARHDQDMGLEAGHGDACNVERRHLLRMCVLEVAV